MGLIIGTLIFVELIIVVGGWKYKPDLFDINNSLESFKISNTLVILVILVSIPSSGIELVTQ